MSEQLGFGYRVSKERGFGFLVLFSTSPPCLHAPLTARRVFRSDGVAICSVLDPFLPLLCCVMLAVDGMVEASKVHVQFYLAPELHAAQQCTMHTSKKKVHVLYFAPLLDTMRCMQHIRMDYTVRQKGCVHAGKGQVYI